MTQHANAIEATGSKLSTSSTVAIYRPARPFIPPLDLDDDTSLVVSLALHLVSEHRINDGLSMTADDAAALHQRLHLERVVDHGLHDLRFRPGKVKAVLSLSSRHAMRSSRSLGALPQPR